jgi:hypothetical protein
VLAREVSQPGRLLRRVGAAASKMIRIVKGQTERLRLHQESVRDKVLKVTDLKHLAELYAQLG